MTEWEYAIRSEIKGEEVEVYTSPMAETSYTSIEAWLEDIPLCDGEYVVRRAKGTRTWERIPEEES